MSDVTDGPATGEFVVVVDDNFHFMQEDERYVAGRFETLEAALAHCRDRLDKDLRHLKKPGMSAEELVEMWSDFGESPFVRGSDFSAIGHVRRRSAELCAGDE